MGNLYTRYLSPQYPRLDILRELKQTWRNKPIDYQKIKYLQKQLDEYDKKHTKVKPKEHTSFSWVSSRGT